MKNPASSTILAFSAAAACMALLCQPLNAQNSQVYNDSHPNNVWDVAATANWDSSAVWINGNDAIFGGVGETVSIEDAILVRNVTFNSSGYNLVTGTFGDSINLHGAGSIISVGADHTATISAGIIGGALTKSGTGTLVLTGTKTFGGLIIEQGVLAVSSNTSLGGTGGTTGAVTLNGGTLKMTLPGATVTNTHVMTIGVNGGTIHVAKPVTGTPTYIMGAAGNLTGSGMLTVKGDGTLGIAGSNSVLVLTNANTGFTGNVTIQDGGILEYANANGVGVGSAFTINNNGMLSIANLTIARDVTLNQGGFLAFQNGNAGTFTGAIALNGDASIRLQDWYGGTVRNGTINSTITGAHQITVDSGSNLGTGGTLILNGFDAKASNADMVLSSASLSINSNSGTAAASVTRANSLTINTGNLTVNGTGSQNTNDVFGTLNLGGGSTTTSAGVLQGFSTWTLAPNAATNTALTFTNMGTRTAGSWVALTSTATLGLTPGANTANIYFTNGLSGDNLVGGGGAIGSGTESIIPWLRAKAAGDNNINAQFYTYDSTRGVVAVAAVNVDVNTVTTSTQNVFDISGSNLGTSKTINSLIGGGTINIGSNNTLTVTSGAILADANLTFDNGTLNFGTAEAQLSSRNARILNINSSITGSGGLTYVGFRVNTDPTLILAGANIYTGATNFYGYGGNTNIRLTNSLALQNSTLNHVAGRGYTLTFGNGGTSGQTAYTFGGLTGNANLNLNNNNTSVGAVALTIGSSGSADTAATVNTYSGILSNTVAGGSIIKEGVATQVFTGANTYSGGTIVTQGKLLANNTTGSATGTGNVSVGSGATLGGTGSISGGDTANITLGAESFLAVGNTHAAGGLAETLDIGTGTGGSITSTASTTFQFDLMGAGTSGAAPAAYNLNNDYLNFTAATSLDLLGVIQISAADTSSWLLGEQTWKLIDWSGIADDALGNSMGLVYSGVIDNYLLSSFTDNSGFYITASLIPEPSRTLLLLAGLGLLGLRRKR